MNVLSRYQLAKVRTCGEGRWRGEAVTRAQSAAALTPGPVRATACVPARPPLLPQLCVHCMPFFPMAWHAIAAAQRLYEKLPPEPLGA